MPVDNDDKESSIPMLDVEAQNGEQDGDAAIDPVAVVPPPKTASKKSFLVWTAINMAATIGIVFTNKAIFTDPDFKLMQTSFACFHFVCTGLTLFVVSRPSIGAFIPKRAGVLEILPLALSMCLNVVLPNLSLAFSTVTVYQLCRVLLTPMTAIINYVLYSATIPRNAAMALVPVCLGVGITSYYDTKPTPPPSEPTGETAPVVATTSSIGVLFALTGVFASAIYTVLIGSFHKKLNMSSSQLLFNQAPVSSVMLLFAIPFADHIPDFAGVPTYRWAMILMSGGFAALINISQFFIVAGSGPVSSTVVGHLKTVSIVGIGWAVSGKSVADRSALGVLMTISGIVIYSKIMLDRGRK